MTKFRFLALFAALALLLTVSTTVLAQGAPKQPNVFIGEVMIGDEMAMDGTDGDGHDRRRDRRHGRGHGRHVQY